MLAYSGLGHRCLKALLAASEVEVVGVCSHRDDPGERIWFPSVAELARQAALPLHLSPDLNDERGETFVRAQRPELMLSFYYRSLLPARLLDIPSGGAFNMHGSLLPLYRGRAPLNWALLEGATETGVTLHEMVERADAGPIVGQRSIAIGERDDAPSLTEKATVAAVELLEALLPKLVTGEIERRPQRLGAGSYRGARRPEDGEIDWSWPAERVHNLVRAVTRPWPGAFSHWGDRWLTIWKSEPLSRAPEMEVGRLQIEASPLVGCGRGALRLLEWQLDGEKGENKGLSRGARLR